MIQTEPYEFVLTYNKYFHPVDGASGCMDPAVDGNNYGAPCHCRCRRSASVLMLSKHNRSQLVDNCIGMARPAVQHCLCNEGDRDSRCW